MSAKPLVSIVIPVHNDEETIAAAIDSCLAQTIEDIEVICVDDGSTDATPQVIGRYVARDSRVRLIRLGTNMSAFQARRTGILAAKSDYLLFLDGDDELKPEAVDRSRATADLHTADLVGFGLEVYNAEGAPMGGYQKRLAPKHSRLDGGSVLEGLFPIGQPAQGQLWRFLYRTELLKEAYSLLPTDLVLPRVNDLPLLYLVAALATTYVSIPDRLYIYHFGRGGSGQSVETLEQAQFYIQGVRSIESIRGAVRTVAQGGTDPGALLENYESVRLSIIGYVCAYLVNRSSDKVLNLALQSLHDSTDPMDIVVAVTRFYPKSLDALKRFSTPVEHAESTGRSVLLTTRLLTTGGVSGVLLTQADALVRAGYKVTIVARRYGSDRTLVPDGAEFVEMVGRGLPERLIEWARICRTRAIDVIIDHQVMYSRDWPEYALCARAIGVGTIGWLHSFSLRPTYEGNNLHALLAQNLPLLTAVVTLSPLDVAFWKLRGVSNTVYLPNPPSPLLLDSTARESSKEIGDSGTFRLIWWGRLDEHTKRITQLVEIASELKKIGVDFQLQVVGPASGEWTPARFNALARERGLEGLVRAVGELRGDDLLAAIDGSDAFLSTSIIEGYQLTIAEAQSRHLPVFMYELPWLNLVQHNEGIVAAPQGDAAGLARAIAAVVRDPQRYAELSAHAVVAAREALSYKFGDLYEQVLTGDLPPHFSPEPTLETARELLDLTVFYADQSIAHTSTPPKSRKTATRSARRGRTSKAPKRKSLGDRLWAAASPAGRFVLQVAPGLRPLAHKMKKRLLSGLS